MVFVRTNIYIIINAIYFLIYSACNISTRFDFRTVPTVVHFDFRTVPTVVDFDLRTVPTVVDFDFRTVPTVVDFDFRTVPTVEILILELFRQ